MEPTPSAPAISRRRSAGRLLWRNPLFKSGLVLLLGLAVLAAAAPLLTRARILHQPIQQHLAGLDEDGMPLSPGGRYFLGTDNLGRDVLSRVIYAGRVSLTLGVGSMLVATVIGVTFGLISGFYGGKLDLVLMRFTEMNMTIPSILLAIAFAGLMDGRVLHLHPAWLPWHFLDVQLKRGIVSLFILIGFVCWPGMVRVIRGQVLAVKEREFVVASRVLGASDGRLMLEHVLPTVLPTVIVIAAMTTANTIALEAGLGYLGIGVPPPTPTWGGMIAEGQAYFIAAPALVIAPGLAIVLTVLALNLIGQGLQEALDTKQKS